MQNVPSDKSGTGKLLKIGRRVMASLKARRITHRFAARLKGPQDALKKAQLAFNDAEDGVIDARAVAEMVHFDVLEFLTELELDLFGAVKKDRKDPRYQAVFEVSLTKRKSRALEANHEWFVELVPKMKRQSADSVLKENAERAEELLTEWKAPLAELAGAEKKEHEAGKTLDLARNGWFDAYVSLHGALEEAFPRRKAFVESFFPKQTRLSKKQKEEKEKAKAEKARVKAEKLAAAQAKRAKGKGGSKPDEQKSEQPAPTDKTPA